MYIDVGWWLIFRGNWTPSRNYAWAGAGLVDNCPLVGKIPRRWSKRLITLFCSIDLQAGDWCFSSDPSVSLSVSTSDIYKELIPCHTSVSCCVRKDVFASRFLSSYFGRLGGFLHFDHTSKIGNKIVLNRHIAFYRIEKYWV